MALTPGTRLGVYEVTALIGEGGMGEVYRATDSNLKRSVAIKVLPASVAGDPDRLARFQREAEVLAALNHPHIAAIYGLEKTPDFTALVMELVEGADLSQRIARGAIPLDEALPIAERSSEDLALGLARFTLGIALMHRDSPVERERGLVLLAQVRDMCLNGRCYSHLLAGVDVYTARERARRGDCDAALPELREAVDDLFHAGQLRTCIGATAFLVETLLERGAGDDVAEAEAAIERLAAAPADEGLVIRDIWLLRLRALLARAHGDAAAYANFRDRYRDMAKTLGFEGHIAWAEAMP